MCKNRHVTEIQGPATICQYPHKAFSVPQFEQSLGKKEVTVKTVPHDITHDKQSNTKVARRKCLNRRLCDYLSSMSLNKM